MKIILTIIYRLLNIIYFLIALSSFITFPVWPLVAYIIGGSKVFNYDMDDWIYWLHDRLHKPLDLFENYIEDMDNKCILTKNFWK